jgi:hypothetical protein
MSMRASHQALTLHPPIAQPPPPCSRAANVKAVWRRADFDSFFAAKTRDAAGMCALEPRKAFVQARRVPDRQPPLDSIPADRYYYLWFKSN